MIGFQTSRPRFSNWPCWVSISSAMLGSDGMKLFRSAPVVKDRSPGAGDDGDTDCGIVAHP